MTAPITPRIEQHSWARNTPDEVPGAVIRLGARNIFVADDAIPAVIARLQAVHALND